MASDLLLRRKWTFRAHGCRVVFVKKAKERSSHVLMKALLWALYLPDYPDLTVEVPVGDRYKPDVVALDEEGRPRFWGEAGYVGNQKIRSLARRYRETHFALAKWGARLEPFVNIVATAVGKVERSAPFDLISFPADSAERFIDQEGCIEVTHDDLEWTRVQ